MSTTTEERELIDVSAVAARLRCHRKTVLRAIKRGTLRPAVRTSRKLILFDPDNLTGAGQSGAIQQQFDSTTGTA